jgi:putative FmdB family regulatory protein
VPTYEYQCDKCRRIFEIRQRITEPALTTCEACGGSIRRLLSSAPFILKGDGWYVTDYPSEARKKAKESEKPSSSDKGSGDKSTPSGDKPAGGEKSSGDKGSSAGETTTSPSAPAASSKGTGAT